jgi:hypothetical protein
MTISTKTTKADEAAQFKRNRSGVGLSTIVARAT